MAWFAITSLMAATALARTAAAAYVPNCLWTVQLQDWSPLVHFDPAEQWSVAPVERTRATANGTDSSRTSKGSGAKMTFESPGTRFTAYGQLSNVSSTPLDFAVDGVAMNPPAIVNQSTGWTTGDIADDLAFGMHKITLELNPSNTNPDASFGVHRWTQLTGTVAETTLEDEMPCSEPIPFSQSTYLDVLYDGNWRKGGIDGDSYISNGTAMVTIKPPLGTNWFNMYGAVGPDYGMYNVKITPSPPFPRTITRFNATSTMEDKQVRLYYVMLDHEVQYTIKISSDGEADKLFGLYSWLYCRYNDAAAIDIAAAGGKGSKNDKAKTNVGAIAGGVVGGVLGAAVIVVLVFYLVRRKRKAARRPEPFVLDNDSAESVGATMTPYRPDEAGQSGYLQHGYPTKAMMRQLSLGTETMVAGSSYNMSEGGSTELAVEHAEDAGSLPMPGATRRVEQLPPTYNPSWLDMRSDSSTSSPGVALSPPQESFPPGAEPAFQPPREKSSIASALVSRWESRRHE